MSWIDVGQFMRALPAQAEGMFVMQRQDELMLSEAFHEGTRQVRKALGPGTPLHIINFDWHGMIKDLKEKETVRCLWQHLQALLPRTDLCAGSMEPLPASASADATERSVTLPTSASHCIVQHCFDVVSGLKVT